MRYIDAQIYKYGGPKVFGLCKSLKMSEKNISKSANFFVCYCFILYKEKMLTDRATEKSLNRTALTTISDLRL